MKKQLEQAFSPTKTTTDTGGKHGQSLLPPAYGVAMPGPTSIQRKKKEDEELKKKKPVQRKAKDEDLKKKKPLQREKKPEDDLKKRKPIQRKAQPGGSSLLIDAPDSPLEKEADAVADKVVQHFSTPGSRSEAPSHTPISRAPAAASSTGALQAPPYMASELEASRGQGQSLPGHLRSEMEGVIGSDLSGVRLHTDAKAAALSEAVNAQAFTYGQDVYFNGGKYQPGSVEGRRLLGHEVGHVGQQRTNSTHYEFTLVQRKTETWFRGEASGVAPSKSGAYIHDFGDGFYLTDKLEVAELYAELRASPKSVKKLWTATFERDTMGKVWDLYKDMRWQNFLKTKTPTSNVTIEQIIKNANENYGKLFESFVKQNNINLSEFDAVIGPEYVRGGTQVCIKNAGIATRIRSMLHLYKQPGSVSIVEKPALSNETDSSSLRSGKVKGTQNLGVTRESMLLESERVLAVPLFNILAGLYLSSFKKEKQDENLKKEIEVLNCKIYEYINSTNFGNRIMTIRKMNPPEVKIFAYIEIRVEIMRNLLGDWGPWYTLIRISPTNFELPFRERHLDPIEAPATFLNITEIGFSVPLETLMAEKL